MSDTPLMEPATLAQRLGDPDLRILDIRSSVDGGGRAAYEAGHVPGAIHTDYVADGWRMAKDGAAGLLPEPESLASLFGRLGLTRANRIVIVPAGTSSSDFTAAARVYWTLKATRHTRLSILDGGFARWSAEGFAAEVGAGTQPVPSKEAIQFDPSLRATLEQVEAIVAARSASPALLDTRGPRSFVGDEKSAQAKRAGRLPGALHLETARAYDPATNRLRPLSELQALASSVPDGPVVAYCNTGQLASTGWFVLSELLGRPDIAMYDGSMSQWTQDPARPVETGPSHRA